MHSSSVPYSIHVQIYAIVRSRGCRNAWFAVLPGSQCCLRSIANVAVSPKIETMCSKLLRIVNKVDFEEEPQLTTPTLLLINHSANIASKTNLPMSHTERDKEIAI